MQMHTRARCRSCFPCLCRALVQQAVALIHKCLVADARLRISVERCQTPAQAVRVAQRERDSKQVRHAAPVAPQQPSDHPQGPATMHGAARLPSVLAAACAFRVHISHEQCCSPAASAGRQACPLCWHAEQAARTPASGRSRRSAPRAPCRAQARGGQCGAAAAHIDYPAAGVPAVRKHPSMLCLALSSATLGAHLASASAMMLKALPLRLSMVRCALGVPKLVM